MPLVVGGHLEQHEALLDPGAHRGERRPALAPAELADLDLGSPILFSSISFSLLGTQGDR